MRAGAAWTGLMLLLAAAMLCPAQETSEGQPLAVKTPNLPKAFLHESYNFKLLATGGILPLRWTLSDGTLPAGIGLAADGVLSGTPSQSGRFPLKLTVTDSGKPGYERHQDFVLQVVSPLFAEWDHFPKITGQRLEGSVKVSNQSEHDFDLTMIALAVNDIGRATAIGYQHFILKKGTDNMELPLGDTLPRGAYSLYVDVVAEVPETGDIHRVRLTTPEKLQIQQGP
jgi:hypothetical protein